MFNKMFSKLILILTICFAGLKGNFSAPIGNAVYGHACLQGRRPTMEDAYFVKETPTHAFYGVFDGHGGSFVSRQLALKLYFNIVTSANFKASPLRAMIAGCLLTNQDLPSLADQQGSTAIMALFKNNQIYVGNVGDSRAVLCQAGKAVALSQDHKPDRPDEFARIKKLGGFVTCHGVPRVQGVLAVSRAFGDFALKPYVIAQPETLVHSLTGQDEFLILACDGVWDVFTNQQAVDIVRASLQQKPDPKFAAKQLAQAAYDTGSMDNISVLVVKLA